MVIFLKVSASKLFRVKKFANNFSHDGRPPTRAVCVQKFLQLFLKLTLFNDNFQLRLLHSVQ